MIGADKCDGGRNYFIAILPAMHLLKLSNSQMQTSGCAAEEVGIRKLGISLPFFFQLNSFKPQSSPTLFHALADSIERFINVKCRDKELDGHISSVCLAKSG